MNKERQRRAIALANAASGGISKTDAGNLLKLGRRQIDRPLKVYEKDGLKAAAHGNSGRVAANKTPEVLSDGVIALAE